MVHGLNLTSRQTRMSMISSTVLPLRGRQYGSFGVQCLCTALPMALLFGVMAILNVFPWSAPLYVGFGMVLLSTLSNRCSFIEVQQDGIYWSFLYASKWIPWSEIHEFRSHRFGAFVRRGDSNHKFRVFMFDPWWRDRPVAVQLMKLMNAKGISQATSKSSRRTDFPPDFPH